MDAGEARRLFEKHLGTVQVLTAAIARRNGLDGDEAESFASYVQEKLIEREYRVIRQCSNPGAIRTYLRAVIANCWKDYCAAKWGKYRPPAIARRLGRTAVLMDAYLNRDRMSLEEVISLLLSRDDVPEAESVLREIAAQLPRRQPRLFTDADSELGLTTGERADSDLMEAQASAHRERVEGALSEALGELSEEDRIVIHMVFFEGLSVAKVARALHRDQKKLYRTIDSSKKRLRTALEARGITDKEIRELIE